MNWREIERIRKDGEAFRRLALSLAATSIGSLTEWEVEFIESVVRQARAAEFSIRQAEKLLEIRDGLKMADTIRGMSVRRLIENCHLARLDLSEADEEWIVALHAKGCVAIQVNKIGRLMRCARQLYLVDSEAV